MTTWILILFAHVGAMGDGNSNAMATVPGFPSKAECQAAGSEAGKLAAGTVKEVRYVCVQQTRS